MEQNRSPKLEDNIDNGDIGDVTNNNTNSGKGDGDDEDGDDGASDDSDGDHVFYGDGDYDDGLWWWRKPYAVPWMCGLEWGWIVFEEWPLLREWYIPCPDFENTFHILIIYQHEDVD